MVLSVPKGFKFVGIYCGIKKCKKDLAIAFSQTMCTACGMFTTNTVKAAPVIYDKEVLEQNPEGIRAVVVNSGNANACTGEEGAKNVVRMAKKVAEELGIEPQSVVVASTGVIGVQLPIEKIENGMQKAVSLLQDDPIQFAEAIMTTDTAIKLSYREVELKGKTVRILGIAKGSGMIHPNLATMLSFIFTDAKISHNALKKILKNSVDKSYNMIDVDRDTSTNDSVIVLANGMAQNEEIVEGTEQYCHFENAFDEVNIELARKIVEDGEGATKLIQVEVINASDEESAKKIARSVVSSNLVKTAIYGEDPNWGRIIAAAGYSGMVFDISKVDLHLSNGRKSITVFQNGKGVYFDEQIAKQILSSTKIFLKIDMNCGNSKATAWGCDLTEKYIQINGRYRT